jgi:hypothetical protein
VDEGDLEAEHAAAGRRVDQLGARARQMREGGADVRHLVGNVVHPRAALREEAAHGSVLVERAQQLEPAVPNPNGSCLDPLFLDARPLLDPRAEKTLVRVQRAVEILDRETDVMNRARRLHLAIVFERLAATMRASALALALTAALLAGCGGHKQAAQPNGDATKPASRVFADARKAATQAGSAHVSGTIVSNGTQITLDVDTARGKGAKGSLATNGLQFDLVRIGDKAYVHGSDAFWKHYAGVAFAQLLHNRWVAVSILQRRFRSIAPLTSLGLLFAKISAGHGKLVNDGKTTYKGQQVVAIRDTSDNSRLYVAATGTPYPVAIVGGKKSQSGTITFGDWNAHVSLSAPSGAIDISKLGG